MNCAVCRFVQNVEREAFDTQLRIRLDRTCLLFSLSFLFFVLGTWWYELKKNLITNIIYYLFLRGKKTGMKFTRKTMVYQKFMMGM